MIAAESNTWVRPVSLGVTVTLIVWCFCGWMIDKGATLEGALLATMTGVFQALGFNASAQMRRAAAKKREAARRFWTYTLVVTAGWTAFSAHHAYGVIAGEAPPISLDPATWGPFFQSAAALVLLGAAATIDPLLGWAIEETEKAPDPHGLTPAPLVAKAQPPARRPAGTHPIRRATAAVALATIGAVASPAAAQPAPATTTLVDETGAVAALKDGRSLRSVQRDFGLTYDKVRKLKAALDAGKL